MAPRAVVHRLTLLRSSRMLDGHLERSAVPRPSCRYAIDAQACEIVIGGYGGGIC